MTWTTSTRLPGRGWAAPSLSLWCCECLLFYASSCRIPLKLASTRLQEPNPALVFSLDRTSKKIGFWAKFRHSAALVAVGPVVAWGLCSPTVEPPFFRGLILFGGLFPYLSYFCATRVVDGVFYGTLLTQRDLYRDSGSKRRAYWLRPSEARVTVFTQDAVVLGLYGCVVWDVLTNQSPLPTSEDDDEAFRQHVLQTLFMSAGLAATLLLPIMDWLYPPAGWEEPKPEVGQFEVLSEGGAGLSVFAEPNSTSLIVRRLDHGEEVEILELIQHPEEDPQGLEGLGVAA